MNGIKDRLSRFAIMFFASLFIANISLSLYKDQYQKVAEETIRQLFPVIENFHETTNSYPASMAEIPNFEEYQKNILWILPGPNLRYDVSYDGFSISYRCFPLDFERVYDSEKGCWIIHE